MVNTSELRACSKCGVVFHHTLEHPNCPCCHASGLNAVAIMDFKKIVEN